MAEEIRRVGPRSTIMDRWAADSLVKWATGGENEGNDKLTRDLIDYVTNLSGPSPTPTESILAETAGLSWLALRMHEAHFASASSSENRMSINQAKFHLTKIDRAHARFLATLKTLATVRRLAIPAVQINVAKQQVNQQVVSGSNG